MKNLYRVYRALLDWKPAKNELCCLLWWIQCAYSFQKSTEEYLYMLTLSNRITQYDSWPCLSNYNQTTPSRWFPLPVYRNHTKITCIQRRCSPNRFPVFRTWVFSVTRKSTEYHPSSTDKTQKGYQKSYISIGERIAKKISS